LLTPDNNARLKLKDLFSHPWVIENEKEAKQEKLKTVNNTNANGNGNGNDYNNKLMANILNEQPNTQQSKNKLILSNELKTSKDSKSNKNSKEEVKAQKKAPEFDISNDIDIDIDYKPKKKKKKTKKDDSDKEELVIPGSTGGDFFDNVLGKVKEKNKGKKQINFR
jgi:hypothetical protein